MTTRRAPAPPRDRAAVEVPARPLSGRLRSLAVWAVVVALLAGSFQAAEMYRAAELVTGWRNMAQFAAAFLSPNFHEWRQYLADMVVTVEIAVWGTALAVAAAAPLSILMSANVCPQWVVQPVRRLMDACRAVHEIVFALMFVAAVGLGPFAGVLALAVHNLGVISKLFSETVEATDPRPVEGIRATGAGPTAEVIFGVVPQVLPLWISLMLYRLDTNVRSATTLGIVGAGGIGQTLFESIRAFQYAEAAAQILIVVATVVVIDLVSARVRKSLV